MTVGCDSLEIRQRTQGFASSASSTSHGTLRFRLAGSSLMLVQWVTSPSTSIPVDLARAAVTPRTASARRGVSDVSRSAVVMPLSGVNADSTLKDAAEDDDVDILSARDIAATRYARNHALVEEIFSIYPTSAIVAPPRYSKVTPENYAARMDALRAQKAAEEAEINRSRNVHLKSVAEYIAARDLVWTAFQDLKTAEDSKVFLYSSSFLLFFTFHTHQAHSPLTKAIDANTKRLKLSVVPRKNVVQVTL